MKTLALALATSAITATAAFASADISTVDRDGDRFASFSEVTAVYPGLTKSDFRDIDANRDNRISAVEIADGQAQTIINRQVAGQGSVVLDLNAVDTDGDNFVSFTELAAAYPGLSANDLDDVDVNNDNRVAANELYAPKTREVLGRSAANGSSVVSLSKIDVDGSGFASAGELGSIYPGLSSLDFEEIDLNGDNRISFNELYDAEVREVLARSGS